MNKPIKLIEWQGELKSVSYVASRLGITPRALRHRLKSSPETALHPGNLKKHKKNKIKTGIHGNVKLYEWKGEKYTLPELAKACGLSESGLRKRLSQYSTIEEAVSPNPVNIRVYAWTEEENDYLCQVYKMPGLVEHWNFHARKVGWKKRTAGGLRLQINKLKKKGLLIDEFPEDGEWITPHALSKCLGVPQQSVVRWITHGLPAYKNHDDTDRSFIKVHLKHFVDWALTPNGAEWLSKHLYQNRTGLYWLFIQMGNWQGQKAPKVDERYNVNNVKKKFDKTIDTPKPVKL